MGSEPSQRQELNLTPEQLDKLLAQFDPDRNRAGEKYVNIQKKLMKFFEWRGCGLNADELTLKTINRVIENISLNKAVIYANAPYSYFWGVARNVLREYGRASKMPPEPPPEDDPPSDDALEQCPKKCLQSLPPEEQKKIVRYHEGRGRQRIKDRQELAAELGVTPNALRHQIFWLRKKLKQCVDECMNKYDQSGMN